MLSAKSAALAGFYLGRAKLPIDIVNLIIEKCINDVEPLTLIKSLVPIQKRFYYFDMFDLLHYCSQWDLLRSDCETYGARLIVDRTRITRRMRISRKNGKIGGAWFVFIRRRNGTIRPFQLADAPAPVLPVNGSYYSRYFFYHYEPRPDNDHVLLFFKYCPNSIFDCERVCVGCFWVSLSISPPFTQVELLLKRELNLIEPIVYYEEVRYAPKKRIDILSRISTLAQQEIKTGDIILFTTTTKNIVWG